MNCPQCGSTNPEGNLRCDCGFNFQSGKPEPPGTITYAQSLSVAWLLIWRGLAVNFLIGWVIGFIIVSSSLWLVSGSGHFSLRPS